ncbi:uncharacterized protein LOC131166170 [Malania oleifera]|uniref:uncharacterized protein LOC131166170 n=1 Tax=Malania oleifera TaxID=397392 RepID=UPI0025AEB1A2|nr:uncharacterized protein LOC131166170 [Malania oleifera]XP_057980469.1 uncharacterized protein LOC131166170 [Malania oleifera]
MLMGHVDGLANVGSSKDQLLDDPISEQDEDEEADTSGRILYMASFEELAEKHIQYDTVIWVSISLLLVLAWGIGVIMLLYLPFRRYVLQKDICSRKLYVTPNEVVYKVSRPSFIPFWGVTTVEKHIPLSLVLDIIIEQGCLQSVYGIHTFRLESIARGKAAPVDELLVQGLSNPGFLKKVIITEASKIIIDIGRWKPTSEGGTMAHTVSLSEGPAVLRSPSKSFKMTGSPRHPSMECRGLVPGDLLLHKLEEVNKSVQKIESLIVEKSQTPPDNS